MRNVLDIASRDLSPALNIAAADIASRVKKHLAAGDVVCISRPLGAPRARWSDYADLLLPSIHSVTAQTTLSSSTELRFKHFSVSQVPALVADHREVRNVLDGPGSEAVDRFTDSDLIASLDCLSDIIIPSLHRMEKRWVLASSSRSVSFAHHDADGLCTAVYVQEGRKIWLYPKRKERSALKQLQFYMTRFARDFNPEAFEQLAPAWQYRVLDHACSLLMPPGMPHAVITPDFQPYVMPAASGGQMLARRTDWTPCHISIVHRLLHRMSPWRPVLVWRLRRNCEFPPISPSRHSSLHASTRPPRCSIARTSTLMLMVWRCRERVEVRSADVTAR